MERDRKKTLDGVLSCLVKRGQARARFSRDAQYQLGQLLEQEPGGGLVLCAGGQRMPIPVSLDALPASP